MLASFVTDPALECFDSLRRNAISQRFVFIPRAGKVEIAKVSHMMVSSLCLLVQIHLKVAQ